MTALPRVVARPGIPEALEYRVVWKRAGLARKTRRYVSRAKAERYMLLLGPEPWKFYAPDREDPDELECCPGTPPYECGCGGLTIRERAMAQREEMPALEYLRLEQRPVGVWEPVE